MCFRCEVETQLVITSCAIMAAPDNFAPDIQDYIRKEREDDEKAMADKGGIYLFSRRFDRLTAGWSWVREDPNYIALVHVREMN